MDCNSFRQVAALALLLLTSACADYTSHTRQAREEFYAGKFSDAAKTLEKKAHEDGVDQLLYLFDRATALHFAGDYDGSNSDFHLADKLAEIKDYTSLATEAATLVTNDRIVPYKGEDFEKVLISQYLAVNYLMLGKFEDALVECRRVNQKLYMMISEGKRKYKLNPFASYLSAMIYESQGEWDHAYVDYQAVEKLRSDFGALGRDLYRLAYKNKIRDDQQAWAERYGLPSAVQDELRKELKLPEIVVIADVGQSPQKHPHPMWYAIPQYRPRPSAAELLDVQIQKFDQTQEVLASGRTEMLFSVEQTAIENLDEKYAGILAKKIGGVVAKEVVADQVGKHTDPLIGSILKLGLYAADQADLRSWLTLPRDYQVYRVRVREPGTYKVLVSVGANLIQEKVIVIPTPSSSRAIPAKLFVPVRAF